MKRLIGILTIIALLSGTVGCSDSDYKKAVRATNGVASALQSLQAKTEQWYGKALIDKDLAIQMTEIIKQGTVVNDELIKNLQTMKTLTPENKATLIIQFKQLSTSIEALNATGVLRIKDQTSLVIFNSTMASIDESLGMLAQLLAVK